MLTALALVVAMQGSEPTIVSTREGPEFEQAGKFAGLYLCTTSASGGIKWNNTTKQWAGTAFRTDEDDQIVLKVESVELKEWETFGWELSGTTYLAVVQRPGRDEGVSCWGERGGYHPKDLVGFGHILMSPQGEFQCDARGFHTSYKFNLSTLRFFEIYLEGFVDGESATGNTPYVSAGTCAPID